MYILESFTYFYQECLHFSLFRGRTGVLKLELECISILNNNNGQVESFLMR